MKAFAELLDRLSYSPSRNAKLRLMADYFRATPDPDRGWALAALTDGLPFSFPLRRTLMDMVARRMDPELFRLSRDYVGDTAETIALVWELQAPSLSPSSRGEGRGEGRPLAQASEFAAAPHPIPLPAGGEREASPRLADVVAELALIGRNDLGPRLEAWLDALDATGRWALIKLLTGAPARRRVGAACQDGGGRDGGPCRRRYRGGLARAGAALRAAVRLARGARTEAGRGRCAGLPAADAVACAGGCRLGGARRRRFRRRMEVGRHPRADRGAAAARRISTRARATTSADSFPDVVGGLQLRRGARRRAAGGAQRRGRALQRSAAAAQPQGRVAGSSWSSSRPTCGSTMRC